MSKKIVIAGATGMIGMSLVKKLYERGDSLVFLTRTGRKKDTELSRYGNPVDFDFKTSGKITEIVSGCDTVINFAGAPIAEKRWSEEYKKQILDSRVITTRVLVDAVSDTKIKPKLFINASAIGFYGDRGEELLNENSTKGNGFLPDVCFVWEREANRVKRMGIRNIILRIGIVLSKEGGALEKMMLPYYLFMGGPLGTGRQYMSWVHIDDIVNIVIQSLEGEQYSGIINVVSPNPVRMSGFAKEIGSVVHRPALFRVPEFMLRTIMGESAELITSSQRVVPAKLIDLGYKYKFENLPKALTDLLS